MLVKCAVGRFHRMIIILMGNVITVVGVDKGEVKIMSNLRKPSKGEWKVLIEAAAVLLAILFEKDINKK